MNIEMMNRTDGNSLALVLLTCAIFMVGCDTDAGKSAIIPKKPRPVAARVLSKTPPPSSPRISASVASWKTEEIAMEVGGRIEMVVEPNTEIEGSRMLSDGALFNGTEIARIDPERYDLKVDNAKAEVERAKQTIKGAEEEINKSIPAQIRAAQAEKKLALTEFERSKRLFDQNAGAQSDVDRDEAKYQSAISTIEQLQSLKNAKGAELNSLTSQLLQSKKSLRDAEADREDCTLYASFDGQISDVSVILGSLVSSGQAIATIQMMDPIKIELEVSSEDSRRLKNRKRIPVWVTMPNGNSEEKDGHLHLVDSVADPLTRTYTLTLLVLNKRFQDNSVDSAAIAITDQMWRLDLPFLPGKEDGKFYASKDSILKDDQGEYLWRVNNASISTGVPRDRKVKVSKMRVKQGATELQLLGNWVFKEVEILDDTFDPSQNLVVGKLTVADGRPEEWNGDTILIEDTVQWMLRPGDLVEVDLSDNGAKAGLYVPMDAISYTGGKTYLFLIDDSAEVTTVKRVEIIIPQPELGSTISSTVLVQPADSAVMLEGRQYVTQGTHYLRDGEKVSVATVEDSE